MSIALIQIVDCFRIQVCFKFINVQLVKLTDFIANLILEF